MGNNFFTPRVDGTTYFRQSMMDAPLVELDKIVGYLKDVVVRSASIPTWGSGTLTWSSALEIFFIASTGATMKNVINASSLAIGSDQVATCTLVEIDGNVITLGAENLASAGVIQKTVGKIVLVANSSTNNILYPGVLKTFVSLTRPPVIVTPTDGATITVDCSAGDCFKFTLTQNSEITFSNGIEMKPATLIIDPGIYSPTWNAVVRFSTDVPSPTLTASAKNYLVFRYNSDDAKYDCMSVNKGFA